VGVKYGRVFFTQVSRHLIALVLQLPLRNADGLL
jgi:hypothetical protein